MPKWGIFNASLPFLSSQMLNIQCTKFQQKSMVTFIFRGITLNIRRWRLNRYLELERNCSCKLQIFWGRDISKSYLSDNW